MLYSECLIIYLHILVSTECSPIVIITPAITVMFSETMYSVNEDAGSVQLVLVLGSPQLTDITVQVFGTSESATGTYCGYNACVLNCKILYI